MLPSKFLIATIFCIISHTDLRVRGDNKCSNLDSCRIHKEPHRTCSCDDDCYAYDTCCFDSEHHALMPTHSKEYHCYDDRVTKPVYAKRTCSQLPKVNEHIVCKELENDKVDVLNTFLVTSSKTKVTYWNKNCGVCNNEDVADLTPWTVQVLCPEKFKTKPLHKKWIKRNLTFSWEMNEWGLNIGGEFVNCSIIQNPPTHLVGKLKYCAPTLIETCPTEQGDVQKKCSSYHGERKLKHTNIYFKNVHCAMCNGASLDDLDCIGRNYSTIWTTLPNTVKAMFSVKDWDALVGEKYRYKCSKNFTYDPFTAKCRKSMDSFHSIPNMATGNYVFAASFISLFINLCFKVIRMP